MVNMLIDCYSLNTFKNASDHSLIVIMYIFNPYYNCLLVRLPDMEVSIATAYDKY